MPAPYRKKQRPTSYYTDKGQYHLQLAVKYLRQVPDLHNSQTLTDLELFQTVISELHTLTLMRQQGMDIREFKQSTLETKEPEILQKLKEKIE